MLTQMYYNFILLLFLFGCCSYGAQIEKENINEELEIFMDDSIYYNVTENTHNNNLNISVSNEHVASIEVIDNQKLKINGKFIGATIATIQYGSEQTMLYIKVLRKLRPIDIAFTASVAVLVSLIYINFGCALELKKLKEIIRKPVGPCIGICGQFLVMPLLSYVIGLIVFGDQHDMRLGLLFTGVSPAGGASNVWTCVLDGNIDMSVTMTAVSTFLAFAMMPAWLFTLGPHIFEDAKIKVPYDRVAELAVALLIPLGIGMALKKWCPKVAGLLARGLKIVSSLLILFIVIFASITNAHLFSLFTWKILVAGLALPVCGFILGWTVASYLFKRCYEDTVAIAIETAIQNTGIAIFMLRFAMPQPQADLTIVVPVAVAIMTPLPLILLWIYVRFVRRRNIKKEKGFEDNNRPATPSAEELRGNITAQDSGTNK